MTDRIRVLAATLLLLASTAFAQPKRVEFARLQPGDIQSKLEQVSEDPLPYQAIRLRHTIRNPGKQAIGPIRMPESRAGVWVSLPNDPARFRAASAKPLEISRECIVCGVGLGTPLERLAQDHPVMLEPGESVSVTFAISADWKIVGKEPNEKVVGTPRFPEPGEYRIRVEWPLDQEWKEKIETTIKVRVRKPAGDDIKVLDLLMEDVDLATAMMRPTGWPEKGVPEKLKKLLKEYPESGYADYARLALARAYAVGDGVPFEIDSTRIRAALAADLMDKITTNRLQNHAKSGELNSFAYAPNVQLKLAEVDSAARLHYFEKVYRKNPDALEWLERFSGLVCSSDETAAKLMGRKLPKRGSGLFGAEGGFSPGGGFQQGGFLPKAKEEADRELANLWYAYRKFGPKGLPPPP